MSQKFKKPSQFAYNIVSIGAGAAGLVTSYIGAAARAKVALALGGRLDELEVFAKLVGTEVYDEELRNGHSARHRTTQIDPKIWQICSSGIKNRWPDRLIAATASAVTR